MFCEPAQKMIDETLNSLLHIGAFRIIYHGLIRLVLNRLQICLNLIIKFFQTCFIDFKHFFQIADQFVFV